MQSLFGKISAHILPIAITNRHIRITYNVQNNIVTEGMETFIIII